MISTVCNYIFTVKTPLAEVEVSTTAMIVACCLSVLLTDPESKGIACGTKRVGPKRQKYRNIEFNRKGQKGMTSKV